MKHLYLGLAIVFDVIGSSCMQASDGFTKILPSGIVICCYLACCYFFALSLKSIQLGVAYAIWGGLGILLTTLVSVLIFKQSINLPTIAGILLIMVGVCLVNFYSSPTVD